VVSKLRGRPGRSRDSCFAAATSPVNEMSQTLDPEDAANGLLTNVLLLL
jgi:hypothetical protein